MDKKRENSIRDKLLSENEKYENIMMVPRLVKIVVSMGISKVIGDKNSVETLRKDFCLVTGQKPIDCKAKKSIANFKSRKGSLLGFKTTLRGPRMFQFFNMLRNVAAPRIRDFRGFKKSFSGGNFSFGITDHRVFPSVDENTPLTHGMNVQIVTSARTNTECEKFLEELEFPFKK